MVRQQTTMWTALPHGVATDKDGSKWLRLSAIMSPRLEWDAAETTLGSYPDFVTADPAVNWASMVPNLTFAIEAKSQRLGTAPAAIPASAVRIKSVPEPALWAALFSTETLVKAYFTPDLTRASVNSFSVKNAAKGLQTHFAKLAAKPALLYKIPTPQDLLAPAGLKTSPITAHLSDDVHNVVGLARSTAAEQDFQQFTAFHEPFSTATGAHHLTEAQLLARNAELRRTDFHKAIAGLGQYPALLPRLGIVVRFEIRFDKTTSALLANADRIRVKATWPEPEPGGAAPVERVTPYPWTAITVKTKLIGASIVPTSFLAASKTGELLDGYLVVRDSTTTGAGDPVVLNNIDVDIATARSYNAISEIARDIEPRSIGAQATAPTRRSHVSSGLPTLGQPVMSLAVVGAGQRLTSLLNATMSKNVQLAAKQFDEIVNYAEELTRGHRVDVWDSTTKLWHRLCQRTGVYELGGAVASWSSGATELTDEGWVQLAATSAPDSDPSTPGEMRLHEQLFTWGGWSLAVKRPGAALAEGTDGLNRMSRTYEGPDGETYQLGEFENPGLPLNVWYRVPTGTLPRLRFGTSYRFRARAVDLAGSSVAFTPGSVTTPPAGTTDTLKTVTREITHKRYEPVKPPTVVITQAMRTGESPTRLVIRSDYNIKPAEVTSRHICPPRTSFTMAEAHGGFETSAAGRPLDGSAARHAMIAARDAWDFPKDIANGNQQAPLATVPSPIPYLPDIPSRGAALSGLPGQSSATSTSVGFPSTSPLQRAATVRLSSTTTTKVRSLRIPFNVGSTPWYDRRAFKLVVRGIEGTDIRLASHASPAAPTWSSTSRALTVQLAKAEEITVELSSYMSNSDLKVLGMHQWGVVQSMRTLNRKVSGTPLMLGPVMTPKFTAIPTTPSSALASETNALINITTLGRNWMITPAEKLTLVHPVRRPMLAPNLTRHLTAARSAGATTAVLYDWVQIHGKSTGRLALNATWTENVDDPSDGAPKWGATALQRSGQAFDVGIKRADTVTMSLGKPKPTDVKMPVTPVNSITDGKLQRHSFGDTKHRKITYQLVAASRFADYFPADTPITRGGTKRTIHVNSTARPAPPEIDIVVPALKWTRSRTSTGESSRRSGGRVRVYLKRPWFSSGDTERLAVIVWPPRDDMLGFSKLQQYATEWGEDPIFRTAGHLPKNYPSSGNFLNADSTRKNLKLAEYSGYPVTAVSYDVDYDAETDRWFVDIPVDQGNAYFPFIKLALARYQPYSLTGLELSRVVVVDAVQLAPDRSAAVAWSITGSSFTVNVNGRTFAAARSAVGPRMTATVEKRLGPDYAWVPVVLSGQKVEEVPIPMYTPSDPIKYDVRKFWRKTFSFAGQGTPTTTEYRVVLREYETHLTGGPASEKGDRAVYVDVLPLKKP